MWGSLFLHILSCSCIANTAGRSYFCPKEMMKSSKLLTVLLAIMLVGVLLEGCRGDGETSIFPDGLMLREGDVVFRRGGGITSHAVLMADEAGEYSHVGIVASIDGRLCIVHAVPGETDSEGHEDQVKADTPEAFFSSMKASRGAVYRYADAAKAQGAALWAKAQSTKHTPFDHEYDDTDTTKLYCCELVEDAYNGVGVSLVGSRRHDISLPAVGFSHLILPSDFIAGGRLRLIKAFADN